MAYGGVAEGMSALLGSKKEQDTVGLSCFRLLSLRRWRISRCLGAASFLPSSTFWFKSINGLNGSTAISQACRRPFAG